MSDTTTTPRLIPAAAPTVSAWGKKLEVAASEQATAPTPVTEAKQQWPTVDVVLAKDATAAAATPVKEAVKEKSKPTPPKVKSTGKEKWLPLEATIIISTGNNGNKKKNNNNQNNQGKKKGQNQNNQGANSNGKQKKDGQQNKNQNGQQNKKQSEGNGTSNNKKKNQSNDASKKNADVKGATEGVTSLSVKDNGPAQRKQSKDATAEAKASTAEAKETTDTKASTESEQAAEIISSTAGKSVSTSPATAHVTTSTESAGPTSTSASPATQNVNIHKNKKGQQQPQQHRNSEPFVSNNGYYYNNNGGNRGGRKYQNNKPYNMRHSVAGGACFGNIPYMMNYNYGYMPMIPPTQFGYPGAYNGYANQGSRSNSQSPSKGEFATLNMPMAPGTLPAFTAQPIMYNTYTAESDPLMLVVNQLTYYFSKENLVKDIYLRKQMNSSGFVPLTKLIEFKRLQMLTGGDLETLISAAKRTPSIELRNEKVRAVDIWKNWVLPIQDRDEVGKVEETEEEESKKQEENKE